MPRMVVETNMNIRASLRTVAPPVALMAAAAAACGSERVTAGGDRPAPPAADGVVVQVLVEGGFLPAEVALGAVPAVTVLRDGTVISAAAVPAIYPGPAITPLQAVKVDGATVDRLVDRARSLGLLEGPLEFGRPSVADAPDTTVTITAGGTTHRHVANALGSGDDGAAGAGSGLTETEVANRRALSTFVAATQNLPPGERAWVPSAVAVYGLGPYSAEPELPQNEVEWPLAEPPAVGDQSCTLVVGDEVTVLLDVLSRASARTPWLVDGTRQALAFRPVVPGQSGCEG